jgi:hypothetical protein
MTEPYLSARRGVLESPELLEIIFDYCDMTTLVQISLVDRFFEATTAPIIYGKVNLSHPQLYDSSWDAMLHARPNSACWQIKTTLPTCDGTLTSRQVRICHTLELYRFARRRSPMI